MNSIKEYRESDDAARFGLFLSTGGMSQVSNDLLIQSRDNCHIECHARVHDVAMSAPWPVQDGASDDRDVLTPPRATCVCSHVKAHHPLSLGAYRAGCIWRGCGCPAFVREAGNV